MSGYNLPHLDALEHEAAYVLREMAAQFSRPALLFSGGKDSVVLLAIARRAFAPARLPFPLLHIDTGHNFPEVLAFRDALVARTGVRLVVGRVEDSVRAGRASDERGIGASRNAQQSVTLLDALREHRFDACAGGARRDEEKSRAKERFFSHRDEFGQWDPRSQRPELWNLFNGRMRPGEHFRVFPLSNWTETDVWRYIEREGLEVPSLYFSHERDVILRQGVLLADAPCVGRREGELPRRLRVRFRTVGDMTCTGAVPSAASDCREVLAELAASRTTERASRADDRRSDSAMEDRKRAGYF
jgi:sulfate adenylyltransferase subunit 2